MQRAVRYKQALAYILMLNTGMRPGEALALKNCDIDLENKKLHIHKTLKEVNKREGTKKTKGRIPRQTKTIIVDSDGDINKMIGTME